MSQTVVTIPAPPAPATTWHGVQWWAEKSGFSFHDLLDTINPLQHLPIVGTIYRAITGDEPGAVSRVVGDGLFGGVWGLAAGLADVLIKADTGEDIGEHVLATLDLDPGSKPSKDTAFAAVAGSPVHLISAAMGPTRQPIPLSPARYILPRGANPGRSRTANPAAAAAGTNPGIANAGAVHAPAKPEPEAGAIAPAGSLALMTPPPSVVSGASLVQRPVPLELSSALMPQLRPQPFVTAGRAAGSALPSAATAALTGATAAGLPQNPPIDISEKMNEALDKYARMMRERDKTEKNPQAGGQVNLMN